MGLGAGEYRERPVYSLTGTGVASLRTRRHKRVFRLQSDYGSSPGGTLLYDLDADPGEDHDVTADLPGLSRMQRRPNAEVILARAPSTRPDRPWSR